MQKGSLSALVWQDKRQVSVLSTLTTPDASVTVSRKEKDGSRTTLSCPTAITSYNRHMAGVDKGDQLRRYYSLRLKSRKNYKYIYTFILDTSITNAYILYNHHGAASGKKLSHKEFRLNLAESLIGNYCGRLRIGRPRSQTRSQPQQCPNPPHFPRKRAQKKRCVYCQQCRNPPCRRETRWFCDDCDGSPPLCMTGSTDASDCWRLWHSAA